MIYLHIFFAILGLAIFFAIGYSYAMIDERLFIMMNYIGFVTVLAYLSFLPWLTEQINLAIAMLAVIIYIFAIYFVMMAGERFGYWIKQRRCKDG